MNLLILTSTFPANRDDILQHPFQMDFIDLLRKDNHKITILTHSKGEAHKKVREDLDIIWFPWRRIQGRLVDVNLFKAKNILALLSLFYNGSKYTRKVILQKRIDLVICLWIIPSGLYLYVNSLLKLTRVPYVLWALGSDINKYRHNLLIRFLLKKIVGRSAYVFADGFELCNTVTEMTGRNCAFLPTFHKMCSNSMGRPDSIDDRVSFLYVGRHAKVKGIDLLIKAVINLEKENPLLKYYVTIIGEGELTPQMMRMVNENNLNHKVQFAGRVPEDRLFELYSQADCVVIPSRSESIPVVLSEALQLNKPMIVTDVGDMGMLGRKYGFARVIEKENSDALAKAMHDFIMKPFHIDQEKRDELLSLLMPKNFMQQIFNVISEVSIK